MSMIGKTLAHYQITSQIGKGGMGEVYQAKDQKLGRDVAIKVLPPEFAKDADRVARFQREAKLLASLNHPNIAAIHGLEDSEGTHFLVMELIEGDTLADRIKSSPIPIEEALKLALQIAEALEAAHEKGVIHRDLKPANIKVTPDGKIKVLDFGLAKAFAGEQSDLNMSNSPTLSDMATQQGVILGTAAYMSPEQARGKEVDKRADIWAFGVVLFEMLTGQPLFAGGDVTSTLARVLEREPDFSALPVNLHPKIIEMLERCLEKDPKDRYSGISDARVDIQKVLADPSGVLVKPVTAEAPQRKLRTMLPWVAVTAIICLIIAGVAGWLLKPAPPQVMRSEYELPDDQEFSLSASGYPLLAISPDGSKMVYCTNKGLLLRKMDEWNATFIDGTDGNSLFPFFSPDSQWIGYLSETDGKLKKVDVGGGDPKTLCDAKSKGGFSWSPDNKILHGAGENIWWIPDSGGKWEKLITHKNGFLWAPQMLPGGDAVMYVDASTSPFQIMVQSLNSKEGKKLLPGIFPRYVNTGHIVYSSENILYAVPFDVDTLKTTGDPVPLLEDGISQTQFFVHYAISDSGTLAYVSDPGSGLRTFVWVDKEGKEEPLGAEPNSYGERFKISPDGTRIAMSYTENGNREIGILDIESKEKTRFSFNSGLVDSPLWMPPDGGRIIVSSMQEEGSVVYRKASNGTGKEEKIFSGSEKIRPFSLSADGKTLFFSIWGGGETEYDIGMLPMETGSTPKLLLKTKYLEVHPQNSPDGRWLAYCLPEGGRNNIIVRPYPDLDSGSWWQVSTGGGGTLPLWSPDSKELYYNSLDSIMAVSVETEPTFKPEKPRRLFPNQYWGNFDIHPDGKKFLMLKPYSAADGESTERISPKINIIINWFEELKKRVPVN